MIMIRLYCVAYLVPIMAIRLLRYAHVTSKVLFVVLVKVNQIHDDDLSHLLQLLKPSYSSEYELCLIYILHSILLKLSLFYFTHFFRVEPIVAV